MASTRKLIAEAAQKLKRIYFIVSLLVSFVVIILFFQIEINDFLFNSAKIAVSILRM